MTDFKAERDAAYTERDKCVALIARLALHCGLPAGLGKHPDGDPTWDREWTNIVFVELPSGQVSWHIHDSELPFFDGLPPYYLPWDGHATPEKYERVLTPALPEKTAAAIERQRLAKIVGHLVLPPEIETAWRGLATKDDPAGLLCKALFEEIDALRSAFAAAKSEAYNPRICGCTAKSGAICTMPPKHDAPHRGYAPAPDGRRTSWWDDPTTTETKT